MLPSVGCSLWSAALRTALCLLDQGSSFRSPWLVLPLLRADFWDAVGVGACSLNSVLFHRPSSKGAFVSPALYGCCSDPSSRHLVLGKGEIHSQIGIFTMEMVSVLGCLLFSWDFVDYVLIATSHPHSHCRLREQEMKSQTAFHIKLLFFFF